MLDEQLRDRAQRAALRGDNCHRSSLPEQLYALQRGRCFKLRGRVRSEDLGGNFVFHAARRVRGLRRLDGLSAQHELGQMIDL